MNKMHHSAKGFLRRCLSVVISMVIAVCFIVPRFPVNVEAANAITEGMYYIEHVGSGRVLDVTDISFSNGVQLQIWDLNVGHQNQVFEFAQKDGYWTIKALHSGKVVEVRNSDTANYGQVAQWEYAGLKSQQWKIINNSDGTVSFQNRNSGKYMDVFNGYTANGSKIIQYEPNNSNAQKFRLLPITCNNVRTATWQRTLNQNEIKWSSVQNAYNVASWPMNFTSFISKQPGVYPTPGEEYVYRITYLNDEAVESLIALSSIKKSESDQIEELLSSNLISELFNYILGLYGKIKNVDLGFISTLLSATDTLVGIAQIMAEDPDEWNRFVNSREYVYEKGYTPMIIIHSIKICVGDYIYLDPHTMSYVKGRQLFEDDVYSYVLLPSKDYKTFITNYASSRGLNGKWSYDFRNEYELRGVPLASAFTYSSPNVIKNYNYKSGIYKIIVNSNSSLRIRSGPSTNYSTIGSLKRGELVNVNSVTANWGSINYNGKQGWICLDYASYEVTAKNDTPSGTNHNFTPVWDYSVADNYQVAVSKINMRSYAATSEKVICQLNYGDIVSVKKTAKMSDGRVWAAIEYNGLTGYCCMKEGNEYWLTKRIVPGKPSVSVTSGTSFSDTVFTWKNCTNAKSYDIRIYDSSGKVVDSKFGLTATSYQTRLKAGSYQVDVASVYNSDSYTFSDRVSFNIGKVTPEKPVVSVSAGNDLSDTHISWNSCKYADCYDMVIYKSDGKEYKKLTNTTATSFTGNLTDIADYYVIVTAKNNTDGTTAKSDQKNFTVVSAVPSKPTLSVLPGNNYTNTTFSWNSCENADSYILDVVNKDTGKTVISETLTATSYEMVLSTAGNYYAQVTSVYAKGNTKNPSEKITFAVESVDVTAFTVSVSGLSDSVIQLEWTESKHATQYDIYRYEDGAFKLIMSTPERSFTDTGLYIGTEYKYYVKSSNQWTSIDSNQVTGETILLYLNGSGTQDSPYLISSADDLVEFSELINDPLTNKMFVNCYYKQTADIDMTGNAFTPIGIQSASFKGNYNGNYCKINGLQLNTSAAYTGLFGRCGKATISNLVVHGTVSSTKNVVGGIAGEIGYGGKIENCAFYGDVSGADYVGGIVGNIENGGTITRCYHMGNVTGNKYVGGIAGEARVGKNANSSNIKISSSYHAGGTVSGTSNGGIVGIEDVGTAKQCSVTYIDCFYLKGSASYATNGGTDAGILVAADTVFQNLVETLGAPYTDGGTTNNHYPVFIWESELYEFQGQGTSSSPYLITNAEELRIVSEYVNDKYLNVRYGNAFYMQTANINLANEAFTPIGNESTPFNGAYNGGYYTISGLNSTGKDAGLFGYAITISIKNLIVSGKVSADRNAGGLLGISTEYVELTQCAFDGTVNGADCGGLIGKVCSTGKIADCYQNGAITGTNAGGLVGSFECEKTASDESLVITASYHGDGSVSGGGAIGLINGDSNAVYTENVYYLKNTATKAGNAIVVNESVLKDLAITLEKPYVNHTMNNGYPVFSWQVSRYEFEGNGTVNSPYIIATADDLIALQTYVNDPSFNSVYGSAYYLQVADIDLGDKEWDAIGINSDCAFNGVYDGNFCTVYGLNAYGDTYSGLFGQVGATSGGRNAGVYNLIIKYGTSCSATGVTGGTAAVLMNGASVDSCSVIGDLSGGTGVGGVVGIVRKSANISNSFHNGNVVGTSKAGGIVGYVESGTARIENCYHTNGVVVADEYCGAIVGFSKGTASISNCYYLNGTADGAVNGTANSGVMSVNATVLQNLSATLGEAYIDNFTLYNSGYPIFAKQFEMDTLGVVGDANADGVFNVADVVMLQKWLLCAGDLTDWMNADLCEDDIIDVFDLVLMKRLLLRQTQ